MWISVVKPDGRHKHPWQLGLMSRTTKSKVVSLMMDHTASSKKQLRYNQPYQTRTKIQYRQSRAETIIHINPAMSCHAIP